MAALVRLVRREPTGEPLPTDFCLQDMRDVGDVCDRGLVHFAILGDVSLLHALVATLMRDLEQQARARILGLDD